jgi:hypothetical protein
MSFHEHYYLQNYSLLLDEIFQHFSALQVEFRLLFMCPILCEAQIKPFTFLRKGTFLETLFA